jgi:hypothetical protein
MTATNATATAVALTMAYVVTGMALQHAAYILQYGGIFNSFRRWLEAKACAPDSPRLARWLCAKFREMLGCQLCSITQLSLLFCAIPATALAVAFLGSRPFGLSPGVASGAYLLFGLGVMFSTAAVGLACWDFARMVGRGSDALILYLRARTVAAEAEARVRKLQADVAIQAHAERILKQRARRRPDAIVRTAGPPN